MKEKDKIEFQIDIEIRISKLLIEIEKLRTILVSPLFHLVFVFRVLENRELRVASDRRAGRRIVREDLRS